MPRNKTEEETLIHEILLGWNHALDHWENRKRDSLPDADAWCAWAKEWIEAPDHEPTVGTKTGWYMAITAVRTLREGNHPIKKDWSIT